MGWCSLSQKLISRSADLARLQQEGYNVAIRAGFLLVQEVPYVNSKKEVKRGTLVVKLVLAGDLTTRPENHVAHFIGEYPCNADGTPIEQIRNSSETKALAEGVTINHTFSAKPKPSGFYEDYYAEISTYCSILSGPAKAIDAAATARTFSPVVPDEEDKSIFNYVDTASSRAEIDVITQKLALGKVAIVGLGGTGAYVLDLVAKTPVREIHLFDQDEFLTHNAFRAPGAPSLDELRAKPRKVNYLAAIYSKMHRGIVVHPDHIDTDNVELLRPMDFIFLCLDNGAAKKLLVQRLEEYSISFVDVGMGVYVGENALGGMLRVTTSTPKQRDHVPARIPFANGNGQDDYSKNIQIADLNALNAALAVIKWKKLFGFYMDFVNEHHSTYGIEVQLLTKEEGKL
jgi:hypothetical protein